MAIKKYFANKDNTITNAFEANLTQRGTGSNMGQSDVLEVFSIYGQTLQATSAGAAGSKKTAELARILIQFPINDIVTDRSNSAVPASGSVDFFLRLYNAKHNQTVSRNLTLEVAPLGRAWEEGFGMDMEEYQDITRDVEGSNWIKSAGDTNWTSPGADFLTASVTTVTLEKGTEDLEINVTEIVEEWISSDGYTNHGLAIKLDESQEAYFDTSVESYDNYILNNTNGAKRSHYTKKFFGKGTEFFFKKPSIEARWDSSKKDQRGDFFYSSSLASSAENLNTVYFYNYFRGQLRNVPGIDSKGSPIYVKIFSGSTSPSGPALDLVQHDLVNGTVVTGGYEATGIYTASFALDAAVSPLTTLFDVWFSGSEAGPTLHTGSIIPSLLEASSFNSNPEYVTTITNLKSKYYTNENPTFRLFTREKNWAPTVYTRAGSAVQGTTIEDGYFTIFRASDNAEILPYGTGSAATPQTVGSAGSYTRMSYDVSGSYFDYDMSLLEPGYMYGLKFTYFINGSYVEQPQIFKFRIEELEDQ
tara:strand:+ start:38476 stop:40068 length:1593 start_codon:yes stop_codon:yes gene_type:complete